MITGDIADIEKGTIIHQVNCQDRIGAGVSGVLIRKYPEVEESYHNAFKTYSKEELFGKAIPVKVTNDLTIVNSYTQFNYGNSVKTGIVYTDMDKLIEVIKTICESDNKVYVPYRIGCGLAGGNWDIIKPELSTIDNLTIVAREEDLIRDKGDIEL